LLKSVLKSTEANVGGSSDGRSEGDGCDEGDVVGAKVGGGEVEDEVVDVEVAEQADRTSASKK
jgi:hypothetical protein